MLENRKFKGVWIPREVWLAKNLTIHEKVMLVEIDSLDNERGCFARNAHFCEFLGVKERRVQDIIKSLKEKGLIDVEITYKKGTKEVENRIMRVTNQSAIYSHPIEAKDVVQESAGGGAENCAGVVQESAPRGAENCRDSNTLLSNTSISNTDISRESVDSPLEIEGGKDESKKKAPVPYDEIARLFNDICKSLAPVKTLTAGRKRAMAARWKEHGESLEPFRIVFEKVEANDYYRGNNKFGWVCTFNWLMNPEKFVDLLERKTQTGAIKHNEPANRAIRPSTAETDVEAKLRAEGSFDGYVDYDALCAGD